MSKYIRKGDKVVAISGNDKGKTGTVLARSGDRVKVAGINVRKKHMRKSNQQAGSIVEVECSIHISNVSFCEESGSPVKVKVRKDAQGERELFFVKEGKEMLLRSVRKTK